MPERCRGAWMLLERLRTPAELDQFAAPAIE